MGYLEQVVWEKLGPKKCIPPPLSSPGLHITLGIFTKLYGLLEDECHALDLELALLSSDSSFATYSQELQMLRLLQSELKQAEEAYAVLQQMTTYVSVVIGEKDPVTADFVVQCEEKKETSWKTSKPYTKCVIL